MTTFEFVEQVICAAKRDHKARKTWQAYAGWARRYALWLKTQPSLAQADSETKVSRYLAHLATRHQGCSPKTHPQAMTPPDPLLQRIEGLEGWMQFASHPAF